MALEYAFLLSRLLQASPPEAPLSEVLSQFDRIKGPRTERFYMQASGCGEQRRETGPWMHWLTETVAWAGLLAYKGCGLDKWGFGDGDVVYDIDEVNITEGT